jgi:hypothetical protein
MDVTNHEQELLGLEKQFWDAMKTGDVDAAVRLTDFPCIVTGAQGLMKVDEPAFRKMMESPSYKIERVEVSDDAQVRLIRDDVAVIAYKLHEELTVEGKPVAFDATDSSTWIRRDGQWRCAQHSESIAGDPFGRRS